MRKWLAKVIQLILIIDDVYDIYGTLADVQQFTVAIEKYVPSQVIEFIIPINTIQLK